MPDSSQIEKSGCEKRKAHNNIEKKRKDKLKIAIDDLRKFLPASITKNIRMSHHEVLLKAMEYMKELEKENKKLVSTSDAAKGEIIGNLKDKLNESYKEIQNLKTIIEKNCMVTHSAELIQSWKSKGKANKSCQATPGDSPATSGSSSPMSHLLLKNKKQKKGLTIAQRLNNASDPSCSVDQISSLTGSKSTSTKSIENVEGYLNSEVCISVEALQNSMAPRFTGKDSNPIYVCYNNRFALATDNVQIASLNIIPTQQIDVPNLLMNNSLTLMSNQGLPSSAISLVSCLPAGISYLPTSNGNSEVLLAKNVVQNKHEESDRNDSVSTHAAKKQGVWKNPATFRRRVRVLHCCNWYWKNLRRRKMLKTSQKSHASTVNGEDSITENEKSSNISSEILGSADIVPKEGNDDKNNNHSAIPKISDSSASNTSKTSKPIWIVAKNMTDSENIASTSKECNVGSCNLPPRCLAELNSKSQSTSETLQRFEAASYSYSYSHNSHLKSDYHEISSLLVNPISAFPDLYDRNTITKAVDQSFMEDSAFYGTGVSYLNEDLQFDIEDDMFPQPSNSPFTNQIPFEKLKYKDGRKDSLSFSFHNEVFSNTFALTDSFTTQNNFNSVDKVSCTNATYNQMSPQSSSNTCSSVLSSNFHHGNIDPRLAKTTPAIYAQSYSTTGRTPFYHVSEKISFSKNESHCSNKLSNANCMFDSLEKGDFSENMCSLARFPNKGSKGFNTDLKLVQNGSCAVSQFETSNGSSVFNPYSNYNHDKMWVQSSSFLAPKASLSLLDSQVDISKISDTQLFKNHFSSVAISKLPSDRHFSSKAKTSSDYFDSGQVHENDRSMDSNNKFLNSINNKEKGKSFPNEEFLSGEGVAKVIYTASSQTSTATKLWNPDQYALNSKPFSFYPLSYNNDSTSKNIKNPTSIQDKVSDSLQTRIGSESSTFRTDYFQNPNSFLAQEDGFKSSYHILSFVPPIKTPCEETETPSTHLTPPNLNSNCAQLQTSEQKPNDPSLNWPKNALSKRSSNNFMPLFSSSNCSDNLDHNSFLYQTSPVSHLKSNSFSSGSCKSFVTNNLITSKSLKRTGAGACKPSKKVNKTSQELFSKCQRPTYYGNYSHHNSYYSSDLLVGPFDKPTYLSNEDQFIPSFNNSEPVSEINLNPLFVPPLPSHQANEVRLNLYQSQCSTGFPPTTTPPLTLSSTRFSSALPSIHHFGIGNIFTDFSNPLTLAVDANNFSTLKVTQSDSFTTSPHYYRDNAGAEVVISAPSSVLLESNYYLPQVHNIFNHHNVKPTNSPSKNSMSINNLLGN